MDRRFTVYRRIKTTQPADQVFAAVEDSLRIAVGGTIHRVENTIKVIDGTNNLNFSFVGDLSAEITLTQPSAGVIDMAGTITLKANAVFWICGIVGLFCLWFLWIANVLYFTMDPRSNYQTALDRVDLPQTGQPDLPPPPSV